MKTPKYVTTDTGPDGMERFYFRRPGQKKVRIHGVPWTPSFMAQYEAAKGGAVLVQGIEPQKTGTFSWLCDQYFASGEFKALDDELSKPKRHNNLLKICKEPIAPNSTKLFGDVALPAWNKKAVRVIRDRFSQTPGTANDLLKALRVIFKWGNDAEHCDSVARDVAYLKLTNVDGWHTWTIEEVVTFEIRWPIGTRERLAMGLLLFTGQRISDAMRLGKKNVKLVPTPILGEDGKEIVVLKKWLKFRQRKNRNSKPVDMEIPLRPELEELIDAVPGAWEGETFLKNTLGRPFTAHNCGDWFAAACIAADVPGRSHGLRKAAASRLAELGATEKEIMSITGHKTSQEIKRYTEAADRKKLAARATALSAKVG